MSGAYYNENDPFAAAWLRALIFFGEIAPGDVDERSIEDVTAEDLRGYDQHHFFAGIGVWSYALRRAGWPDDRPVWTGSCPCQPFSAAGKGGGFADERHLWPAWHWLIDQHRPDVVFGEQVASKDGLEWFDLVSADLEGSLYAVGASDQCVAGFGGPHIRQRLWYVGLRDTEHVRSQGSGFDSVSEGMGVSRPQLAGTSRDGWLSDDQGDGRQRRADDGDQGRRERTPGPDGAAGGLPHIPSSGRQRFRFEPAHGLTLSDEPLRGHWRGADWLWFRDGKYRPVEPGTFPLAHGAPARVGRLRGYGNAICAVPAQAFIEAVMAVELHGVFAKPGRCACP